MLVSQNARKFYYAALLLHKIFALLSMRLKILVIHSKKKIPIFSFLTVKR